MSERYKLEDSHDLDGFANWCLDKLTNEKNTRWVDLDAMETAEEIIPDLIKKFEAMQIKHNAAATLPSPSESGELWNDFIQLQPDGKQDSWHCWRDDDVDLTDSNGNAVGYGGKALKSSRLLSSSSLIQHHYSHPDELDSIILDVSAVEQGVQKMYIGHATAAELDAISMVPWIDPSMESADFGRKLLEGLMSNKEWQRVVNQKRVLAIRDFANAEDSYIFNPVLLYLDLTNDHVSEIKPLNGKGEIKIDFSFLSKRSDGWTDYVPKPKNTDTRPLWIIDGQHRVRGFGASERGTNMPIPYVLIVSRKGDNPEETERLVAKVFTEINTMSVPIDDLHQIYLRYKFGMKGTSRTSDYSYDAKGEPTVDSRPQRRAYELALHMASARDSSLYNMIEFQRPANRARRAHHYVVNSKNWVGSTSKYYRNGIYSDISTDDFAPDEIFNFFKAFENVASMYDWIDNMPRWEVGANKKKPFLQFDGPFLVLLNLFPEVVKMITESEKVERPIPMNTFQRFLSPLKTVDWRSPSLHESQLKGRNNTNIRHLGLWMLNSIEEGYCGSIEDVMSKRKRSIIGEGLISAPAPPMPENVSEDSWPGMADLVIEAELPANALDISWTVKFFTPRGAEFWTIPKESMSKRDGVHVRCLTITLHDLPEACNKISIEATSRNGCGPGAMTEPIIFTDS